RLKNVRFLDPRPAAEIPALLAAADALHVPLKAEMPGAVPSKLYEAMSSGRPVVLIGTGEAAEIVQTTGAGITVRPGAISDIVHAIRRLEANPAAAIEMGQSGRRAALERYDRKQIAGRFIDYLEGHSEHASTLLNEECVALPIRDRRS